METENNNAEFDVMSMEKELGPRLDIEEGQLEKVNEIVSRDCLSAESPAQILDHVYLGNSFEAANLTKLRSLGITHVLNLAASECETSAATYKNEFSYHAIAADDLPDYDMTQHFDEAFEYIDKAKSAGGKVLVHCFMGINRSGIITTAYLMKSTKKSLLESLAYIKQKRTVFLWNESFQQQLITYANKLGRFE